MMPQDPRPYNSAYLTAARQYRQPAQGPIRIFMQQRISQRSDTADRIAELEGAPS